MVARGRMQGRESEKVWMDMYTLLYLKWITIKDLLDGRGNSAQCYVAAWMGRGDKSRRLHMCRFRDDMVIR